MYHVLCGKGLCLISYPCPRDWLTQMMEHEWACSLATVLWKQLYNWETSHFIIETTGQDRRSQQHKAMEKASVGLLLILLTACPFSFIPSLCVCALTMFKRATERCEKTNTNISDNAGQCHIYPHDWILWMRSAYYLLLDFCMLPNIINKPRTNPVLFIYPGAPGAQQDKYKISWQSRAERFWRYPGWKVLNIPTSALVE